MLFSAAICDKGRALGPVDPREVGRCCHESVLDRERGTAPLGEVLPSIAGFKGACGRSRGASGRFSFEGPSCKFLEHSPVTSSSERFDGTNVMGDFAISPFMALSAVDLIEVGVPALEDGSLVGEMDLARSNAWSTKCPSANTIAMIIGKASTDQLDALVSPSVPV